MADYNIGEHYSSEVIIERERVPLIKKMVGCKPRVTMELVMTFETDNLIVGIGDKIICDGVNEFEVSDFRFSLLITYKSLFVNTVIDVGDNVNRMEAFMLGYRPKQITYLPTR